MPLLTPRLALSLIGRSAAVRTLERDIDCAAQSDATVLITGETGTGKEVVARLVHDRSPRTAGGLVTLNCAGLPDTLLESELFGHARGSFTGAVSVNELLGTYASVGAHAGAVKSSNAQVMTKGDISLALSGTGKGWDLGVDGAAFTISRR